jgi:predicted DNA-binding protein YlxM (UPF0122 family)
MEVLEKKEQLNQLYDLYKNLLTEKQVLYFELYYHEDYSLQEIAELYQVSRNAVFDHLKKVEEHLFDYEEKLKLYDKQIKRMKLYEQIEENKDLSLVNELRKLDE